jgi:uridine kinase
VSRFENKVIAMPDEIRPYSTFEEISEAIRDARTSSPEKAVLVGIDGGGGSGKSTLANKLSELFDNATVVHIDDFADWTDDSNWELSTFADRVLVPLVAGITSKHQRYDWPTDTLGDWFEVVPSSIVIVEGVTALRPDLRDYWQVAVWVDCPRELRLERGVARDGEAIRSKWVEQWMPGEDQYFERDQPRRHAAYWFNGG